MIARRTPVLAVAAVLALTGCAVQRSDFDALREQVRLQQKQITDLKARQEEMGLRVDSMNNGFKIMVDKVDESSLRIDDLEERATAAAGRAALTAPASPAPAVAATAPAPLLATAPSPAVAPPAPPSTPAPPAAAAPAAAQQAPEEPVLLTNKPKAGGAEGGGGVEIITAGPKAEKLYANALSLYSKRDYQQAAERFQEFVTGHPDHKLAGNAQYWIGECLYSQKRFAEAAEEFDRVEKAHPTSPKVPAALLKKGLSLLELKRTAEAQAALQRLLDKYGQSEEAAKARERLERLKQ